MVMSLGGGAGRAFNSELGQLLTGRDTRWYRGHLGKLNLIIAFLVITQANNGYDGSMMNTLQTIAPWRDYFHNPHGPLLGVFNAIQTIGGLVGMPFTPYLADWVGRRYCLVFGLIFMLIGTAVQTAANSVGMFIGCRFLIGFGLSFAGLAAPLLIGELAFPSHRGTAVSFFGVSYSLGAIIAAWVTFGTFRIPTTWSWRIPSLLQGLPTIIQLIGVWFIPESPRWLISKDRDEEALNVLAKHHCGGDMDDPLVMFEYQEIKEALHLERENKASSTYRALFATPGNRRRMVVIIAIAFFSQWSGNGLVSYYLNLVLNGVGIRSTGQQTLFNGILSVFNYGAAILGALVVDKAGRRTLFLTSTGGMCLSYVFWTVCSAIYSKSATNLDAEGVPIGANVSAGHAVLAFIFLFYGFYNIGFSPLLSLYSIEILPFTIRAKAMTVGSLCINAALVFNQYINPVAMDALGWKYYIVYCCWLAVEFVVLYFTIVETVGKDGPLPLEVTNFLFDGQAAVDEIERHGAIGIVTHAKEFTDIRPERFGEAFEVSREIDSKPLAEVEHDEKALPTSNLV